jgi:hypothetical protein
LFWERVTPAWVDSIDWQSSCKFQNGTLCFDSCV